MQRIWNQKDRCWENVRCLKKLSFSEQPERKFFLHRSFETSGFTVTELQTGAAVCQECDSTQEAVKDAKKLLGKVSKETFQGMIDRALLKQTKNEMNSPTSSDPFPEDRTGEPGEFREEDL